ARWNGLCRCGRPGLCGPGMDSPAFRHTGSELAGRWSECAQLDELLAAAHSGQRAVLVLRGEPGVGKSALLKYAGERATGGRVLGAIGAEWEMELPFAGLHQLIG